ncbi:SPOR domain-containing protein [Yoonia sp. R2331]|uniref:SPOR domain-containing protein n=1 Tax=Yoonia sp. R2331 TaxID=3237238 RepID=UPI0034E3B630
MAVYEEGAEHVPLTRKAGVFANYAGAAVSLGLMAGIGVWGYQLIMRDVTGIPVVRAMEGAMRVAPENPGGEVALHTGLAVNAVAAEGAAAAPEDRLVLAPAVTDLAEEDLTVQPMAEADEVVPTDPAVEVAEVPAALTDAEPDAPADPLETDDILALVDQLAAGVEPMAPLDDAAVVEPTVTLDGAPVVTIIDRSIPGVTTSLRPPLRPAALAVTPESAVAAAVAEAVAPQAEVTTAALPTGTKLVQLGAFPTPEAAAQAWVGLEGRFSAYLGGKEQLIQEAERNGKAFYRLRAKGFADLSDARRFCAALEAGNADCIPVVVR